MIEMGRYGAYVWPAYVISGAVLAAAAAWTLLRSAAWRRRAERAERGRRTRVDDAGGAGG